MSTHHIETLSRSLTTVRSRRGALPALLAGALGLASVAETAAKKKKGTRKKKGTDRCPAPPPAVTPPCGGCPVDRVCLRNGSCALPCVPIAGRPPCPGECSCPNIPNEEGQDLCIVPVASCNGQQPCTTTGDCPAGAHCMGCWPGGPTSCFALCPG